MGCIFCNFDTLSKKFPSPALTLAGVVDVHGPRGDEVEGRGRGVGAVHVGDEPRQSELPLGVRVLLSGLRCSLALNG